MKFWALAGFLTGFMVIALVMHKVRCKPAPVEKNPDMRYRIDDFLADQEL